MKEIILEILLDKDSIRGCSTMRDFYKAAGIKLDGANKLHFGETELKMSDISVGPKTKEFVRSQLITSLKKKGMSRAKAVEFAELDMYALCPGVDDDVEPYTIRVDMAGEEYVLD